MNLLEKVLQSDDPQDLEDYLECIGGETFKRHLHEIKVKAAERAILDKMKELSGETK